MDSKNYFKTICDVDLDLSAIGFGDNLTIDYNQKHRKCESPFFRIVAGAETQNFSSKMSIGDERAIL